MLKLAIFLEVRSYIYFTYVKCFCSYFKGFEVYIWKKTKYFTGFGEKKNSRQPVPLWFSKFIHVHCPRRILVLVYLLCWDRPGRKLYKNNEKFTLYRLNVIECLYVQKSECILYTKLNTSIWGLYLWTFSMAWELTSTCNTIGTMKLWLS